MSETGSGGPNIVTVNDRDGEGRLAMAPMNY
jgi:hypothetical protein